ncbi:Uncharacterised protein [Mycobacteroides abscessus]|uniref:hypothetical protein n=1 Tax=Mycobacteroides abscessus TaxID=36809 RepID=UPI0005E5F82F|nr:hypothetical protein [Mycobacteroides abscessus]CPX20614.1 Uncharacterised protein [Mycobacteroides abscessus]CRG61226.1 Uncharacterised protein [Mycobacteroides abscessus]
MSHDEIPAYSVESLEEHAQRVRDIASRMDADEVDDLLGEVAARIESSESVRHPEFDLDVPDTEDIWNSWSNADKVRDVPSLEELADMMDATADSLRRDNADAQETHDEDAAARQREADEADNAVRAEAASRGLTDGETEDLLRALKHDPRFGHMYVRTVNVERAFAVMDLFKVMIREGASRLLVTAVVSQLDLTTDRSDEIDSARHLGWTDELTERILDLNLDAVNLTKGWVV